MWVETDIFKNPAPFYPMRVVVTGGRFWKRRDATYEFLDRLHEKYRFTVLIEGEAEGADTLAREWAETRGVDVDPYPVTRDEWKRHGKKAGNLRNQQMIDEGKPELGVIFPGESGTKDMVERLTRANIAREIWKPT